MLIVLVFVDTSSSTSSAAGGHPLGIVITPAESADIIHEGMTTL